jgi:exodeoxyribonuclease V gamma subunit
MSIALTPGLLALHSNRTEDLAMAVATHLRQQPLGPLEEEVILVQSNGMAEWVKMTLAQHSGVCAATRVELPARFMWRTYRQVLGAAAVPSTSPLDKTPLTWRLMRLLPLLAHLPGFEPVAAFLRPNEPIRLLQLAARLADLFDQYQVYRADWLMAWAKGDDVLLRLGGQAKAVPVEQRWQPLLWRAILAELDDVDMAGSRPQLHQNVVNALRTNQALASPVARRVVVFGMTHMPLPLMELMASLGGHSQILLAIPNPCRFHWGEIMDGREVHQMVRRHLPLRQGRDLADVPLEDMHAHAHPLLAAWGRQGRDFVRQTDAFDAVQEALGNPPVLRVDIYGDDQPLDASLLGQVQNNIRDLVPLAEHGHSTIKATDQSIVFHVAHSALRELEILHDQLLQMLIGQPDASPLHPRDVVVMVPAIDTFAPAIKAVFGQYGRSDKRYIPYDIADLSAKANSTVVLALEWLLHLPTERSRLSDLRDLLEMPVVAQRFGIAAEDVPRLVQWMDGAGIRWGLNLAQRNALGLANCGEQNTALFGLRRMLMGYAVGTSLQGAGAPRYAAIEPYVEVGGLDAELAGCLAHLLTQLAYWLEQAQAPAAPAEWAMRFRELLAALFKAQTDEDDQTLSALDDALGVWQEACYEGGYQEAVSLAVAGQAWLDTLEEPTLHKRFKAGGVTFCTLLPMRAIPFDVVCLLGMNDGDFPRSGMRSDFDLMGLPGQFRPGDRARRDDDRQLMLEAVLSARKVLYVSWTGRNARDNTEQPPSVLVSQLRDYLAAGWAPSVVEQRTIEHALQPFSRRYFEQGTTLRTYAREWRAAHVPQAGEVPFSMPLSTEADAPLSQAERTLTVDQLVNFFRNPVSAYFRQRLRVVFDQVEADGADEEAFKLKGLEKYTLESELVTKVIRDLAFLPVSPTPLTHAEMSQQLDAIVRTHLAMSERAGSLPMGAMGNWTKQDIAGELVPMLTAWLSLQPDPKDWVERQALQVECDEVAVQDWLGPLCLMPNAGATEGEAMGEMPTWLKLVPSKMLAKPKKDAEGKPRDIHLFRLLYAYVCSAVAAASRVPVQGILVGLDATLHIYAMLPEEGDKCVTTMLDSWRQGMQLPLPLPLKTALAHAQKSRGIDATYEGDYLMDGEGAEACLMRMFPDFEALTEDGRFAQLADAMYGPMVAWAKRHVRAVPHPAFVGTNPDGGHGDPEDDAE